LHPSAKKIVKETSNFALLPGGNKLLSICLLFGTKINFKKVKVLGIPADKFNNNREQ